MIAYRVFPYLASAAADEPGGALYVPPGGKNRADSPNGSYRCLYLGDSASGAIAESFGRFASWDRALIEADPALPTIAGTRFALAEYEIAESICDLDDARRLVDLRLRPSEVVTRDRSVTQRWASYLHASRRYSGVAWWSYYDAGWKSLAIWDVQRVRLLSSPRILTIADSDVVHAASIIIRQCKCN